MLELDKSKLNSLSIAHLEVLKVRPHSGVASGNAIILIDYSSIVARSRSRTACNGERNIPQIMN